MGDLRVRTWVLILTDFDDGLKSWLNMVSFDDFADSDEEAEEQHRLLLERIGEPPHHWDKYVLKEIMDDLKGAPEVIDKWIKMLTELRKGEV